LEGESTAMSEPLDPAGVTPSGAAARGGWEFLEILATVILAAESLRVVGSVVSGIIFAATAHVGPFGEQQLVGSAMVSAANFSDGPGIVLLLVSFALLWWRAEYWTKQVGPEGAVRAAAIQAHRLRSLARWATGLFTLAAAGALAFLIGNILVNTAGGVPTSDQWQAYFSDSFSVAYLVIALAGLVATLKLAQLCEPAAALDSAG
jgi:hypothetical protein